MSANAESPRPLPWGVVLVALLLGAAWRLAALRAEFWLDEILSWDLARQAGWPGGVFVLRHDNNHVLNTLWLTLWPDNAPTWLYRWHTLTAGLATIVVAAIVASRWGRATSGFAALLVAGNPWLVLVSAEARGYSLAVLASLAAFFFLRNYLDRRDLRSLLLFWLASCLGFLGHLTFIYPYLGFLVWSLRRFARAEPGRELAQLVRCHLGVGLFCVGFYLVTLRGMHIEGAPAGPVLPVVARLLVLGLGGPDGSVWGLPYLAIAAGVVITGSWLLWARGDDAWIFFTVTVVAAPTLYLLRQPPFLFERYLLLSFVFFLLLVGVVLGALWQRGRMGQVGSVLLLLVYLAGSGWHLAGYVEHGRGHFGAALAWVLEQDNSDPVRMAGDDNFRLGRYVAFYGPQHPGREIEVVSNREAGRAEWVFVHRLEERHPIEGEMRDTEGNRFRLARAYPAGGPAGWGWFVYRRVR